MPFELPKPSLVCSIEKIFWNLRITKHLSIGCTPSRSILLERLAPDGKI